MKKKSYKKGKKKWPEDCTLSVKGESLTVRLHSVGNRYIKINR